MQTKLVATDANGHLPTSLLVGARLNCQRAVNVLPEWRNLLGEQPDELSQYSTARPDGIWIRADSCSPSSESGKTCRYLKYAGRRYLFYCWNCIHSKVGSRISKKQKVFCQLP